MCGIAGIVGTTPDEARLRRALGLMTHRGPDGEGVYVGERVALGHRRLAIIDLTARGAQPMHDRGGRTYVSFNGEIYNFRELRRALERHVELETSTDTEVLLHGYRVWGIDALLARLDGMFAFALWDGEAGVMHLARDRVGKKPLYYHERGGALYFASTLPALLELLPSTPAVSARAVADYLHHLAVPRDLAMVEGVHKLLPAERAEFSRGVLWRAPYWRLSFACKEQHTSDEWLARVESEVRRAVRARLVSERPLGVFLSGGVDSSLVTALMAQESRAPVTTIAAGFDDVGFDELEHARAVARHLGTEHHELHIRPELMELLPHLVFAAGEPFGDHALLPTMALARAARPHATVVLTGDGGDEGFAGYPGPLLATLAAPYAHLPPLVRRQVVPRALALLSRAGGVVGRRARQAQRLAVTSTERFRWRFDMLGERGFRGRLDAVLHPGLVARLGAHEPDDYWRDVFAQADGPALGDRVLATDIATQLPDLFLPKTDIATMAYGVEARSPLLDHHVLELAARIPMREKLGRRLEPKHLLKRLAARHVPASVVYRKKHGLSVPTGAWLRQPLLPLLRELLLRETFARRRLVRDAAVRQLIDEHVRGAADHGQRLWLLMLLELWHRMFIDKALSPSATLEIAGAA